jgi:hypothetical protein
MKEKTKRQEEVEGKLERMKREIDGLKEVIKREVSCRLYKIGVI